MSTDVQPTAPASRVASNTSDWERHTHQDNELVKGLGLTSATMLVMGSMIGSGIFIVSAEISREVASPALLIGAWVITGFLTIVGALTYGELAAMTRDGNVALGIRVSNSNQQAVAGRTGTRPAGYLSWIGDKRLGTDVDILKVAIYDDHGRC